MASIARGSPRNSARAAGSPSARWNVGLCGRGPEGLQLMRNPLGRIHPASGFPRTTLSGIDIAWLPLSDPKRRDRTPP
jgi:hypothetical protein